MLLRRIGILGLGLIGGSIFKALKEKRDVVVGEDVLERLGEIDILILAVPISSILEIGKKLASKKLEAPLVILDVGSVKEVIAKHFEEWTKSSLEYVATHPMAGKEQSGFENSDPNLFQDAPWVITPHAKNTEIVLKQVEELIQLLGAHPIRMEASLHDKRAALISHVPYVISKALLQFVSEEDRESLEMAGPGFKSMTRLARDNLALREEIGMYNKNNISAILKKWIKFLEQIE
jgi:prephenate dehydrogenase